MLRRSLKGIENKFMTDDKQTKMFNKAAVIFYSRSGNTRFVAEEIANRIGGDLLPLKDGKSRKGAWGYFWGGFDSLMQHKTKLANPEIELNNYDLVFIGCPNWAANMAPAVRAFMEQKYWANKKVIFFCTQESMGAERVFNNLRRMAKGADVLSEKFFNKVNENKDAVRAKIHAWLDNLGLNNVK